MSKSLGNSIFASDLLDSARPLAVRYYLGSAHYRSVLDYHEGVLDEAESAMARIETFIDRAQRRLAGTRFIKQLGEDLMSVLPAAFVKSMDEDLAIPSALAAVHEAVRSGNAGIDNEDLEVVADSLVAVLAMTKILGIDPTSETWSAGKSSEQDVAMDALIRALIAERNAARASKDFARSDAIRDQLKAAGITLEDAADSTHWSVN